MPQLDLAWFFFNFLIAWILVLVVISLLSSQKWSNSPDQDNHSTQDQINSSQWRW